MFAFVYNKLAAVGQFGTDVVTPSCEKAQGAEAIALSYSIGKALQSAYILSRLAADLLEELLFKLDS